MPAICRFRGITIRMYLGEGVHAARPHFHAVYAGQAASFGVVDLIRLTGRLPLRIERLVRKWAKEHEEELLANWDRARDGLPLKPVAPLK